MKKLLIGLTTLALLGCSAKGVLVHKKVNYDPTSEARIRVFQLNGNDSVKAYSDVSCEQFETGKKKVRSKNPFAKENMYIGLPKSTLKSATIGIPLSEHSVKALDRKSHFDTDSFTEQVISANKPAIIRSGAFGYSEFESQPDMRGEVKVTSHSFNCYIFAEFTPKAGKDYEAYYHYAGDYCTLQVNELEAATSTENPQIKAKLGKAVTLKQCKNK